MSEKILVTGGMGFIGTHLIKALSQKGYSDIVILDNLSEQIHGSNPEQTNHYKSNIAHAQFIHGSVTNAADWKSALEGVTAIIHLAAETGTGQSMYQIARYTEVNIGGTALMLDILANDRNHKVRKIIVASSRSIYGEGKYWSEQLSQYVYPSHRKDVDMAAGNFEVTYGETTHALKLVATDEQSKIHPSSVYGITKQNQEQMVMTVCPTIGIAPVAFRYQNVYGAGQSLSNPYTGILSIFSTLIKHGKSINIFEDGKESRDFVYVEDVVAATIAGLEQEKANGNIYNVGSGVATDVSTVAQTLIRKYGTETPVAITGNYRLGDIRHNFADISLIKKHLSFVPTVSFEEGIQKFANWVNEQSVGANGYDQSIAEMKERGMYK